MRASQWFVMGFAFLLLGMYFGIQDMNYERMCNLFAPPKQLPHYNVSGGIIGWEEIQEPITRSDLWCINTEIYDPFIEVLFVMWIVCWVNGFLEGRAGRNENRKMKSK
jgi:hypothetical protein